MGRYLNLCKSCLDDTGSPVGAEYLGLTMSLAPECSRCGNLHAGRFAYYAEDGGHE